MAKKKKTKIALRPWCWYCEREFEDEKVLMQHQKAKHFKCHQCPRRLNTAGGLAVHIQQVHKLDPDQLPRIDNALPGRDGYEVEIFGMEGIPAPDVADYKRRKEQELGLPAGSISGSGKGLQQNKRPRIENRILTEEELRVQLEAHKALMGGSDATAMNGKNGATDASNGGAVYNAAPQTYANPPVPAPGAPPFMPGMPPPFPPPQGYPGAVPGGPLPPFPPFAPGAFPPGMPPPGFPFAPPMPPPGARPPMPPGVSPLGPPPGSGPPLPMPPPTQGQPPQGQPLPPLPHSVTPPSFVPASSTFTSTSTSVAPSQPQPPPRPRTPNPPQTNPPLKAGTVLIWSDANYSPAEKRSHDPKYYYAPQTVEAHKAESPAVNSRGTKRARAEDFL